MTALFDSAPPLRRQPRKSKRVVFRRQPNRYDGEDYVIYVDGKRVGWISHQNNNSRHRQGEKWELRADHGTALGCRWNYTLREAKDNAIWYFGGDE